MEQEVPRRIAILGAGPIGLEAALYGRFLGYEVVLYEQGSVASHVEKWGHVAMFTPFSMNSSPLALSALEAQDPSFVPPPVDAMLTGKQWREEYLLPLSQTDLLSDAIRTHTRVLSIGRSDCTKSLLPSSQRDENTFRLLLASPAGEEIAAADIVIDAGGVYENPRHVGPGGIPAVGERELAGEIETTLPDILGKEQEQYADRKILLVGSGYSAATAVVWLAELAGQHPHTKITWITRRGPQPIQRIENDRLAGRDQLALAANELAGGELVRHLPGAEITSLCGNRQAGFQVEINGEQQRFERIISLAGYKPELEIYRELQVHLCYATEGPMKLAANLLGETSIDCLDQSPGGPEELANPEPDFFILGAKSFGRNSNFLYAAGLKQIRDAYSLLEERADLDLYARFEKFRAAEKNG